MAFEVPRFLDVPEVAWVSCEAVKDLSAEEIACTVKGILQEKVVIAPQRSFDRTNMSVSGVIIGTVGGGHLVDFPYGDRLLAPDELVRPRNGDPVRS